MIPYRDTAVGRAQADDSTERCRLLHRLPVSLPSAHGAIPAATAAAAPWRSLPERGPGPRAARRSEARVLRGRFSIANSSMFVFPSTDELAVLQRVATVVEHGDVAGQDLRAGRRLDAPRRDHVLERRSGRRRVRLVDGAQERIGLAVPLADRVEVGAQQSSGLETCRPRAAPSPPPRSTGSGRFRSCPLARGAPSEGVRETPYRKRRHKGVGGHVSVPAS